MQARSLPFQLFIAALIGLAGAWVLGFSMMAGLLVLAILTTINWATDLPGTRCNDLMNAIRDIGRIVVAAALFAFMRIMFWSAFGFSMIESLNTGHGVGPRGAMSLSTPANVRETIIWECMLSGVLIVFSFLLAKTVVPKKQTQGA